MCPCQIRRCALYRQRVDRPFDDNTFGFLNRRFTKPELLGYVDWCRGRVRLTLDGLTEEMAARPLPSPIGATERCSRLTWATDNNWSFA